MKNELESAIKTVQGDLVIGNHDSIILLGAKPQAELRDCSRSISKLLVESSVDLDVTISDVIYEIQRFQDFIASEQLRKHKILMKKYSSLFKLIDDVSLYLKLQQAQLIKEIKMLESLRLVIDKCITDIEDCLSSAKAELRNKEEKQESLSNNMLHNPVNDFDIWYVRLGKRIDDLNISHTVALQSQAQIKMLVDNNRVLIDKIASAISNTLPIWQNQMALLLGVELLEQRLDVQTKVLRIVDSYINKAKKPQKQKLFGNRQDFDYEKMLSLNRRIEQILAELDCTQNEDNTIRNSLQNLLFIER